MSDLIAALSAHVGVSTGLISQVATSAPVRYKTFFVPKKGQTGLREINQPSKELKLLQRGLVDVLLSKLPIHPAATAYRSGLSIRENALRHAKNDQLLKLDFKEFFTSIQAADWLAYCEAFDIVNDSDARLAARLMFMRKPRYNGHRLAMGAPSSPTLSNILMFNFDKWIVDRLDGLPIVYTRYADDLTFSAPRTGFLNAVRPEVARALRQKHVPHLVINHAKTVTATKKYRRSVTGLILSNDGRVTIGREKKRKLRSQLHHAFQGNLTSDEMEKLSGMLAFLKSAEPEHFVEIQDRYGHSFVSELLAVQPVRKWTAEHRRSANLF